MGREARSQGRHVTRGGQRWARVASGLRSPPLACTGAASPLGAIRRGHMGRGHGTAQTQAGLLSPACSLGLGRLGVLVALALLTALGGARGVRGRGGGRHLLGFDGTLAAPRLGFLRGRGHGGLRVGLGTQRCTRGTKWLTCCWACSERAISGSVSVAARLAGAASPVSQSAAPSMAAAEEGGAREVWLPRGAGRRSVVGWEC